MSPRNQPFTVLLMMSDDIRSDESCAADWIRRVWVWGNPEEPSQLIFQAKGFLAHRCFEWDDPDLGLTHDEILQRMEAMEPVAIYPGHIFDLYQP